MNLEQVLSELEQFHTFFSDDFVVPIERYSMDQPKQSVTRTNDGEKNKKTNHTLNSSIQTVSDVENKKIAKEERKGTLINKNCKCFFALIKPKGTATGTRQILLYAPPYNYIVEEKVIVDEGEAVKEEGKDSKVDGKDGEKPGINEMEILPRSAQIWYEGRYLTIITNKKEREYTIKSKQDVFQNIVSSEFVTPLIPFILSILGCGRLPPTGQMLLDFMYNTIYTDQFLVSFYYLPPEIMDSKENGEDYLKLWVQASDPSLDTILEKLFKAFFQDCPSIFDIDPFGEFPFKIASKILEMDSDYTKFVDTMASCTSDKTGVYLSTFESMPFNQRSQMLLHIVFTEASKRFTDSQAPSQIVSFTVFNSSLRPEVLAKNPDQNLEEMNNLVTFTQTAVCLDHLKRYEQILSTFKKQPRDYETVKRGRSTFEAFIKLLDLVNSFPSEFLNVARRIESLES